MLRLRVPPPLVATPLWAALGLACGGPPGEVSGSATEGTSSGTTAVTTTSGAETEGSTTGEDNVPPTAGPLRAGVALGFLDGPVGVSMAGYGGRTVVNRTPWNDQLNGSRGFRESPSIKAMVLEVEGERLVLLKVPTMSSEASLTEGTAAKLLERHGIDLRGRIITGATHSHHTQARYWRLPSALGLIGADSPDEEVIERMSVAFADTIKAAIDDLGPAEWGYAWADGWDDDDRIYRDRRGENDPTYGKDPRLTLVAVRRPGGEAMATIINFGMHGTLFDSDNEIITEDAAGGLELRFEEAFYAATGQPILGMFIQSGGGDASPAGGFLGHRTEQKAAILGGAAAPKIIDLYNSIEWRPELALSVRSRRHDLRYETFGYDKIPEFVSKGGTPYTWGGWQCTGDGVDDNNPATSLEGKPKECMSVGALLESLGAPIPHGEVHQVYMSAALLDELALVTMPGEPTHSVVKYARELIADRALDPIVFGYSQDHLLYLTHPDDWFQGGYETEMSLWGPFAARTFVELQAELIDDLVAGVPGPDFSEESPNLSTGAPFDARALEASEDAGVILKEPVPEVSRMDSARFAWGGGDPSVDAPHVTVLREEGGAFVPAPSPGGWPAAVLDNRRDAMITWYTGDPTPKGEIAASRKHHWEVAWEIPVDFPAGTYRLVARGRAFDGAATSEYELSSAPFVVTPGDLKPTATLKGDTLTIGIDAYPPPPEILPGTKWVTRGYRVHDPEVGPDGPFHPRVPLVLAFTVDGVDDDKTYEAAFDPELGVHVFDFSATGLEAKGLVVRFYLKGDVEPGWMYSGVDVL